MFELNGRKECLPGLSIPESMPHLGYYIIIYCFNHFRLLLEHGASVDNASRNLQGGTALTCSCGNGHVEVAQLLLQHGANVELRGEYGDTPLESACKTGNNTIKQLGEGS